MKELTIYVDGASKGNPGKAGIGIVFFCEGKKVKECSQYIGITTNNVAEYMAVVFAMQEALIMGVRNIAVFTDSELVANQVNGVYKVKNNNLFRLHKQVQHLKNGFKKFNITHIERAGNKEADKLASRSVDRLDVCRGGKSGLQRARCPITRDGSDSEESATENKLPRT